MKALLLPLTMLGAANAAGTEIGDKNWIYNFPDIGPKYPGYWEGKNLRNIRIDLYFDLFCSACAHDNPIVQAFLGSEFTDPVLGKKTVLDLVRVNYNYVPLPYHHSSWVAALAMQWVINKCYADETKCQFHEFQAWNFTNQDTYLGMVDNTGDQIIATYTDDVVTALGLSAADEAELKSIYTDTWGEDDHKLHESIWWQTAQSYKQGTNHQVSGTPSMFVNGIELDNQPTSVLEWTQALTYLIDQQESFKAALTPS